MICNPQAWMAVCLTYLAGTTTDKIEVSNFSPLWIGGGWGEKFLALID